MPENMQKTQKLPPFTGEMWSHWISTREISTRQIAKTAKMIFAHTCEVVSWNDDLSDRARRPSAAGQIWNCVGVPRRFVNEFRGGPPFSVKAKGRNLIGKNSCPTLSHRVNGKHCRTVLYCTLQPKGTERTWSFSHQRRILLHVCLWPSAVHGQYPFDKMWTRDIKGSPTKTGHKFYPTFCND